MIVREATEKDLPILLPLCKKTWAQLGVSYATDLDSLRRLQKQRFRIMVLYDGKDMVAALVAHPLETDRGPGYTVNVLVVDLDRPDRMTLVDAISMYACNIAMSEGRRIVVSKWQEATFCLPNVRYGRDVLAFDTEGVFERVQQTGDAQAIIENILKRHPEWQLP